MPGSTGKGGTAKGGSSGSSSPATNADEDLLARKIVLRHNFDSWAKKRKKPHSDGMISYENSPSPPIKRF